MNGARAPSGLAAGVVLADRYRVLHKLGEGALGAVYLAEHIQIGRRDALKVLHETFASDPEAIARFLRGARNLSAVRHPNICTIYDFTETQQGVRFLAMEYVDGSTLKEVLHQEGRLPADRSVAIAAQIADALQAAHEVGVVHRDLKPSNIMLVPGRGGGDVVKVVDFDIAKGTEGGEEVTRLGFVVGTPEYMSPEQLTGEPLDGRSDLYSLGLVLFRMLTGVLPFRAEGPQDLMLARLTSSPMQLNEALPDANFSDGLQRALNRALQRKPADRHADTAEVARQLRTESSMRSTSFLSPTRSTGTLDVPPTRITTAERAEALARPTGGESERVGPDRGGVNSDGGQVNSGRDEITGESGRGRSDGDARRTLASAVTRMFERTASQRLALYALIGTVGAAILVGTVLVLSNGRASAPHAEPQASTIDRADHSESDDPDNASDPSGARERTGVREAVDPTTSQQENPPGAGQTGVAAPDADAPAGGTPRIAGQADRPLNVLAEDKGQGSEGETAVGPGATEPQESGDQPFAGIEFASPGALDEALLALSVRLHDLDAPPRAAGLAAIRDTLLAALDQSSEIGQRRSAARLLALVELHRGNPTACLEWSDEVDRLEGDAAELDALCSRRRP